MKNRPPDEDRVRHCQVCDSAMAWDEEEGWRCTNPLCGGRKLVL